MNKASDATDQRPVFDLEPSEEVEPEAAGFRSVLESRPGDRIDSEARVRAAIEADRSEWVAGFALLGVAGLALPLTTFLHGSPLGEKFVRVLLLGGQWAAAAVVMVLLGCVLRLVEGDRLGLRVLRAAAAGLGTALVHSVLLRIGMPWLVDLAVVLFVMGALNLWLHDEDVFPAFALTAGTVAPVIALRIVLVFGG